MATNGEENRLIERDVPAGEENMKNLKKFRVMGHSPYSDAWVELDYIYAASSRGANMKAHRLHGIEFSEFGIWEVSA